MQADLDIRVIQILADLEAHGDPRNVEGMARYGIRAARAYGVPGPVIRQIARALGTSHPLAARLWATGVLDARAVAALIDDPRQVDGDQMEQWAADFDSWAICDHVCGKLFDRTALAWTKARTWAGRREEFVRRAGFSLMAWLAVHDKQAPDRCFLALLPLVERAAGDDRPMVHKAVNWALRQIGKRNPRLHRSAIACGERIRRRALAAGASGRGAARTRRAASAARWVAADALRELRSGAVRARLAKQDPAER